MTAAYTVFAHNAYRDANMNDIAWKAGISKSLLFYYFKNKRELYLFLWNEAARTTYEALSSADIYASRSLFGMMEQGMIIKLKLFKSHPQMALFALRAFLEKDPEVQDAIQASYASWFSKQAMEAIQHSDASFLRPGMDVNAMLEQIRLASEGYLFRMEKEGLDIQKLADDSCRMMQFWKQIYEKDGKE